MRTAAVLVLTVFVVASSALAATYNVTTSADLNDGSCTTSLCSLRDAIAAANANPGADQINLSGATYILTLMPAGLTITDAVTINGNGSTIDAGGRDRVFDIQGTVTVTLNNLTITGGNSSGFLASGGGIRIRGANVALNGCVVTGNVSGANDGGGIAVSGSFDAPSAIPTVATLTLSGSTVSNNHGLNGGGIVCVLCALTIANSTISGNVASGDGGGIDILGNASTLTMTGSNLVNNGATRGGGLAAPFGTSSVSIGVSRITGNSGTGAIFNAGASSTFANDDWWGCNYGPGIAGAGCAAAPNGLSGPVTVSRYLVLNVGTSPPTLPINATSTVTADLTANSLGANTSSSGTVPDGIAASFTATRGTPASTNATTNAGRASFVYTATGPKGTATVTASIDGQTASASLNVGYASFTDDPLVPGVTIVKAMHVLELRARINAVRLAHGLGAYPYSALAAGTIIQAQHINELRTALAQAYAAMSLTAPAYTDPTLTAGTVVKAVHIAQIRAALVAVE